MNFRDWCPHHFPGGSFSGDTYSCKNVFRGEKNASLSITEHNQKWFDHGTGEGGDIRFLCHEHGIEAWDGVKPWEESRERKDSPSPDATPTEADAVTMWGNSVPVESHPYLDKKELSGEGLRITTKEWRHSDGKTTRKGTLLIPAKDIDGVLHGVERILPDSKLHLGRKARCFFGDAPEPGKSFLLAEGYATACAIRRLSGWPAAEIFGFACLENAAKAVTERHPGIEVVLCPDRVNEETQRAVVNRMKEKWTVLELPDERPKNHDWDDEVRQYGLEAAKETFRERWGLVLATEHEETKEPEDPLDLQFYDELEFTEPEFLIDDLIEKHTTGLMFGATASRKSFLALDMAACVATGRAFHGRVVEEGPVVYLAGEGKAGILKRIKAWEQHTGKSLKGTPFVAGGKAPRFGDPQGAREAIERIRKKLAKKNLDTAALVVVDTLARAAVGLDENSNQDMSEFVGVLDSIKNEFDCVVLTVHHSGHMEAGRARGASCVPAAMDFIFEVKADEPYVTLTAKKMKDAEEPAPITFEEIEMVVMEAKDTKRGKPVTSLALEEVEDSPREKTKPLTDVQQLGLNTFREAARKTGTLDVHLEVWREFFYRGHTGDKQDTKKKAFNRARKELVELGKLAVKDDIYSEAGEIADLIRNETAKRDTGQSGTLAGHVPLGTLNERDKPGHTPIGVSRCPACVPVENDTREEKEECPAVVLPDKEPEKEEPVFPPRGKSGASSREKKLTPAEERLALKTFMIAAEKVGTLDKDGAFVGLHLDDWRPFFLEKHTGADMGAKKKAFNKAREQLTDCGELSVKNDYYRLSGVLADQEKGIVEKLRESGSHKSQEEVTGDAHADVAPSGEGEKEPVILLSRGSLEKRASTSGVSIEKIRESLKAWEECGRVVIVGKDIYERPGKTYPKKDLPEEAEGQDEEDAASPEPEKGEEGPADSSSRGDSDNGGVSVPDVSPACTREETSDAPSEDLHPAPCIEPEKEEPVFLSRGEETPAEAEGQAPGDSSPRGEDPVFLPRNGEVVFPDPLPLPFMWPGKGWIVEVEILGDGSRSFGLSPSKSGKARSWLREPKGGKV